MIPPKNRTGRAAAIVAALCAAAVLSACMPELGFTRSAVVRTPSDRPATVDASAAAAMISEYRRSRGLPPVTVDARLMAIAATQARAMAAAGRMAHTLPGTGSFPKRLAAGGYDAAVAAENLAAGPSNLDQAMASWRGSPGHNANLLKPGVTGIGIAVSYSAGSKYRDFWALVLAAPDDRRASAGPDAGPLVPVRGHR